MRGLEKGTRQTSGFAGGDMGCAERAEWRVGVTADEIGSEKVKREGKPEKPFVVSVQTATFLLWPGGSVEEFHPNIEHSALDGSNLLFRHCI